MPCHDLQAEEHALFAPACRWSTPTCLAPCSVAARPCACSPASPLAATCSMWMEQVSTGLSRLGGSSRSRYWSLPAGRVQRCPDLPPCAPLRRCRDAAVMTRLPLLYVLAGADGFATPCYAAYGATKAGIRQVGQLGPYQGAHAGAPSTGSVDAGDALQEEGSPCFSHLMEEWAAMPSFKGGHARSNVLCFPATPSSRSA